MPDGKVIGIAADFNNVKDVDNILDELDQVDILINNAGIFEPQECFQIPDEDWTTGVFLPEFTFCNF